MATRRELWKLGAVGAFGVAGMKGGDDDDVAATPTAPPTASLLDTSPADAYPPMYRPALPPGT